MLRVGVVWVKTQVTQFIAKGEDLNVETAYLSAPKPSTADHPAGQGAVENMWTLVTKGVNCPPLPRTARQAQDRLKSYGGDS